MKALTSFRLDTTAVNGVRLKQKVFVEGGGPLPESAQDRVAELLDDVKSGSARLHGQRISYAHFEPNWTEVPK